MQKIMLATIFIREINDFILISDFKYEPIRTLLSYEKITIRFCCFCSTATVANSLTRQPANLQWPYQSISSNHSHGDNYDVDEGNDDGVYPIRGMR